MTLCDVKSVVLGVREHDIVTGPGGRVCMALYGVVTTSTVGPGAA